MQAVVTTRDAYGPGRHRYNRIFLDFAHHYGFQPRLCQPYRPRTKGKVERFIRYLRASFYVPLASQLSPEGLRVGYKVLIVDEIAIFDNLAALYHLLLSGLPLRRRNSSRSMASLWSWMARAWTSIAFFRSRSLSLSLGEITTLGFLQEARRAMEIAVEDEAKFIDFPRSAIFIARSGRLSIEDKQRSWLGYGVGSANPMLASIS
jgi:hypothetical protein